MRAQQVARAQVVRIGGDRRFQHRGRRRVLRAGRRIPGAPGRATCGRRSRGWRAGHRAAASASWVAPVFSSASARSSLRASLSGSAATAARRRTTSACGSAGVGILGRRLLPFGFCRRGWLDAVLREELAQLAFRQRALESVDRLAALDEHHGRDRADLERRAEFLFLVDVDLREPERAVVFGGELFEDRPERLARSAPRRPEVDEHRRLQRCLDDVGLEVSTVASKTWVFVLVMGSSGRRGGVQSKVDRAESKRCVPWAGREPGCGSPDAIRDGPFPGFSSGLRPASRCGGAGAIGGGSFPDFHPGYAGFRGAVARMQSGVDLSRISSGLRRLPRVVARVQSGVDLSRIFIRATPVSAVRWPGCNRGWTFPGFHPGYAGFGFNSLASSSPCASPAPDRSSPPPSVAAPSRL